MELSRTWLSRQRMRAIAGAWPCGLVGWIVLGCAAGSPIPGGASITGAAPPLGSARAIAANALPRVVDLQWGGSHCALRDDGRVACWGRNKAGSLGDGTVEARDRPAFVPGIDHVRLLRGLPDHGFCALRDDASLWCWGFGNAGDLTVPIAPLTPRLVARGVATFGFNERSEREHPSWHGVCARHLDGSIACTEFKWSQRSGRCAYWADEQRSKCLVDEKKVDDLPHAPPLEADNVHYDDETPPGPDELRTCVLRGRQVFCHGHNWTGILGDPSRSDSEEYAPVPGLDDVVQIANGAVNYCAVRANGALLCWGRNEGHELVVDPDPTPCVEGKAKTPCLRRPTVLPVGDVAQAVRQGTRIFVVTRAGELLVASPEYLGPPWKPGFARIDGLPPLARAVPSHTPTICALSKAGEVYCYGNGADLGTGELAVSRRPVQIPGVHGAVEVHVAEGLTGACARLEDGRVVCWGEPTYPLGLRDVTALGDVCALTDDRRVWCWGDNAYGEMGLGRRGRPHRLNSAGRVDPDVPRTPLPVPRLGDVVALAGYLGTTCTADRAGAVRCWGTWGPNATGGIGTLSPTPVAVPPADEVSVGPVTCALARDRTIWCWVQDMPPARVPELTGIAHLASYGQAPERNLNSHKIEICAIGEDRSLRCANTPAPMPAMGGVRQVSLAGSLPFSILRGCAVLEDGLLRCWGAPYCAEGSAICAGEVWNRVETLLDRVKQVAVGDALACAVRTDGTVWCWGRADGGGLGGPFPATPHVSKVDLASLAR